MCLLKSGGRKNLPLRYDLLGVMGLPLPVYVEGIFTTIWSKMLASLELSVEAVTGWMVVIDFCIILLPTWQVGTDN